MRKIILIFSAIILLVSCINKKEENTKMKVGLTTLFTNDLAAMKTFFNTKMKLPIASETPDFIEFETGAHRFSIGSRKAMYNTLKDSTYLGERKGAAVGIGFYFSSKEEVDNSYTKMMNQGIEFVQKPTLMPWNEYTAFFKDPDGNVHELISKND